MMATTTLRFLDPRSISGVIPERFHRRAVELAEIDYGQKGEHGRDDIDACRQPTDRPAG